MNRFRACGSYSRLGCSSGSTRPARSSGHSAGRGPASGGPGTASCSNQASTSNFHENLASQVPLPLEQLPADAVSVPTWSGSFTTAGTTYPFTMVGTDPAAGQATHVPVEIIPLRMDFRRERVRARKKWHGSRPRSVAVVHPNRPWNRCDAVARPLPTGQFLADGQHDEPRISPAPRPERHPRGHRARSGRAGDHVLRRERQPHSGCRHRELALPPAC